MKDIICFIDDSGFEHDLLQNEIAPCAPDLEFVQACTFEQAREELVTKIPSLFLLDLWGKDETIGEPYFFSRKKIEEKIAGFPDLDYVYGDLGDLKENDPNEFLKRLFAIVDNWRSMFEEICALAGQNRKYGLSNLARVREHYPDIPAVFYTRKSLINDAVALFKAGADGLFIKPTGSNDKETRRLTREYAPQLITELRKIMASGSNP